MLLIERYIHAVTEYLPEDIRSDVGKELRANIEDMLPDNYTEKDVHQVLTKLGNPWKLAGEYNPQQKYLIGPGYYHKYISILKLVIAIVIFVLLGITILEWIIAFPADGNYIDQIAGFIGDLISAVISGALQGAFWVTLVFVILERTETETGDLPFGNKKWTPDDLPEVPADAQGKISRGDIIFEMFLTILFVAMIYLRPQLIAIYQNIEAENMIITPLFNLERLEVYLPVILIMAVFQLAFSIWKYIKGWWTLPLATVNAVYNVALVIVVIVMLTDITLFNPEFSQVIADITHSSAELVSNWIVRSKWIFGLFFVGTNIWESAVPFVKSWNRQRK